MHQTLLDRSARRWLIGAALLAGLAALIVTLAPGAVAQSQGTPQPPHWFWGEDADSYAGSTVQAFDQNGDELVVSGEGQGVVGADGGWFHSILRTEATRVSFRLTNSSGSRQTALLDVISGNFQEVPISEFTQTVTAAPETKSIRVIARLHPTRELRTLEFNIRVDGVDVDPAPRARFLGPDLAYNRWLQSSVIDAGDGFEVRVIACKQDDDDVIFGVRVEGEDDIIPRARRLGVSITHNRWLQSSEIPIPMPGDNANPVRLRADQGCTGGSVAP